MRADSKKEILERRQLELINDKLMLEIEMLVDLKKPGADKTPE
jgi:hypothetical protein